MAYNEKQNIVIEIPIFCSHSHRSKISNSGLLKTRNSPSPYLWNGQRDKSQWDCRELYHLILLQNFEFPTPFLQT